MNLLKPLLVLIVPLSLGLLCVVVGARADSGYTPPCVGCVQLVQTVRCFDGEPCSWKDVTHCNGRGVDIDRGSTDIVAVAESGYKNVFYSDRTCTFSYPCVIEMSSGNCVADYSDEQPVTVRSYSFARKHTIACP